MEKIPVMIRSILCVLFSLFMCQLTSQSLTYEDGLRQCDMIRKKKMESNPKGFIFVRPSCMEGARMPEFEATTLDGRELGDEDLLGKVTVLNFWFIACQPCIAEIPGLHALQEKYVGQAVNFVAISRDDEDSVIEFLQEYTWGFDHIASEQLNNDVFKIKWGYPTTFVLDRKGQIIFATSGGKPDESAVEEVQLELIPVIDAALK